MRSKLFFIIVSVCLSACLKDRTFDIVISDKDKQVTRGIILINEISANGSTFSSEFGGYVDWIEFYNPGSDTINLSDGRWYTTDDLSFPNKYQLPERKIAPHGFLVICCDGVDSVNQQIHTNFSLSSNGESAGLYYKTDGGPFTEIDSHVFGAQAASVTIGRIPDGSSNWTSCSLMTPGSPNQ
jgi:hypothetical protein